MKLLEMVKDIVSPPPKSIGGIFSLKEAFHGGKNIFGQILGDVRCVTWGLMIRSYKEGGKVSQIINPNQSLELWKDLSLRLMVKRLQVQFPSCLTWDIIFEK